MSRIWTALSCRLHVMSLLIVGAALLASSSAVSAAPLDEARTLYDQQKYEQVDDVLDRSLSSGEATADVLMLSYRANREAGRMVTANRRITTLLDASGKPDPAVLLEAARAAERAGDRSVALSRYLLYTDRQAKKSPDLREALVFLSRHGAFPEQYRRLIDLYGTDDRGWELGKGLLQRVLEEGRPEPSLDFAAFLLDQYHAPNQVLHVEYRLRNASDRQLLGRNNNLRHVRPMELVAPYDTERWDKNGPRRDLWNHAIRHMSSERRVELLFAMQEAYSDAEMLPWSEYFHDYRIIDRVDDLDRRHELSRKFLDVYREHSDEWELLDVIRHSRGAFRMDGRVLIDAAMAEKLIDERVAAGGGSSDRIFDIVKRYIGERSEQGLEVLARHAHRLKPHQVRHVLVYKERLHQEAQKQAEAEKEPTPLPAAEVERVYNIAKKNRDAEELIELHRHLWDDLHRIGLTDELWRSARRYVLVYPNQFDADWAANHIFSSNNFPEGDRLSLLEALATKAGQTDRIDNTFSKLAEGAFQGNGRFDQIQQKYKGLERGRDPLTRALAEMSAFNGRKHDKAMKIAKAYLDQRDATEPLPADWSQCDSTEDMQAFQLLQLHRNRTGHRGDDRSEWAATWLPHLRLGWAMEAATAWAKGDVLFEHVEHVLGQLEGVDSEHAKAVWKHLGNTSHPRDNTEPIFADHYAEMGPENAVRYLMSSYWSFHRSGTEARSFFFEQCVKIAESTDFMISQDLEDSVVGNIGRWIPRNVKPSQAFFDAVIASQLRRRGGDADFDWENAGRIHQYQRRSGHTEAAERLTQRVLDAAAQQPLPARITAIETFLSYSDFPAERDGTIAPGGRYYLMVNRLAPLYEKLPRDQYFSRGVRGQLDGFLQHGIDSHFNPDEVALEEAAVRARETLVNMRAHLAERLAAGADFWGHDHASLDIPRNHLISAAQRGRWLEVAAMASHLADRASVFDSWGKSFGRMVKPSIDRLMEAEGPEIAFALIRRIEADHRLPEQQAKQLSIAKAQAARQIPDLISVPESDPTYDIHLAAHQLTLGNESRAWALSRSKLDRLRESWQEFDPAYVAWVIDQMRKQKQLEAAMNFAMNVLLEEDALSDAVAAEVSLTKADIFRDMENYQAARVEYESLTASDRYKRTSAGDRAKYRLIELLIITRDYGSAEQMLARIENSPDPREQAEAYYYYARIAYEQENYKQAAEHLEAVQNRVMSHVEAAFLEGELALVLPGGLQQTEVRVGNPELATIAIPGRELNLKLQDPNLSIARGNASIPVVVTTTRGGDLENIELMPSATAQNTFSGTIPTALGTPEKDNLRLELRGDDQVTYNIAPAFQEANDLDYAPKVLEVKSDARLVASSGEILSVEEQEQRELQQQLAEQSGDDRHWAYRNDRAVRPGNPIHVQVTDADRDLGPDRQTVTVDLETSSGDRIRGFELTETGAHDAVFRGSIPSGLPLPTARASDTFEDSHPANTINTSRPEAWSSLPDGNTPKWIEVDTMSSHEVRSVSIQSPDLDRLLAVRLLGSLGGEFEELAAWPVGREERGLTVAYFKDKNFENKVFERTDPSLGFNFRKHAPNGRMPRDNFSARWTGYIVPDEAGEYTFHLDADDQAELWIDGESVAKVTNHRKPSKGSVELDAKPHEIRIEMVEGAGTARMRLQWEGPSIERQNIADRYLLPDNGSTAGRMDGLRVHADDASPGTDLRPIRQHLMRSDGITYYQKDTSLDRRDTPYYHGDFWYAARMTGAFYVPESRVLELKMTQGESRRNHQHVYILIDGKQVFGGRVQDRERERTFRVPLSKGVHNLEIVTADRGRNGRVELSYRTDEGTFEPLPAEWFSVDAHPELAGHVMPKAKINFDGDRIVATMNEPERLRTLRWVFESFAGNQISVTQMRVLDTDRNRVIPVERDFREGLHNDTLEIAPGDEITVTYDDVKRLNANTPTLASTLNARYFDGEVRIVNEIVTSDNGQRRTEYNPARRFSVGDQLAILVEEYDADLTADADTIEVVAESSSGGRVTLDALEQPRHRGRGDAVHSGRFLGILKTSRDGGGDTLAVEPGDRITVRYLDRENTDPGVPVNREYSLYEGGERDGEYFVYRTRIEMREDDSIEARSKLRRLERKRGEGEGLAIYREQVIATHPAYSSEDATVDELEMPAASSHAPLLFELKFPALAKHSRSELEVKAVSESELQAARAEGRNIRVLNVPVQLESIRDLAESKGSPIRLRSRTRRGPEKMLEDGVFAGIIRLQIGSPGDPVNDLVLADANRFASQSQRLADTDRFRVPTLVVTGSDVVHLKYEDPETGEAYRQSIQLRADARLELMERSFTARDESIHLGEAFHVRVIDPDQDVSAERDTVTVRATAPTGDALTVELSETHAHSGEFTASFTPEFAGAAEPPADASRTNGEEPEPAITPNDDTLHVNFGDEVVLTYEDSVSLTPGDSASDSRTVTRTGRIHLGGDGELASFTKKFADPEMAVKTSFLTAEAMFELAKQYRELDESEKARDHIAEGKMLLEEALEDYPDTTLKARGDFLLANLEEELNNHSEAVVRYSQVIRNYPDSEFAARSQFKKGLNYEKLERYEQSTEAYVRTTYIYPDDTDLVAKATVRLARYYYQSEKYDTAGSIFSKFQERNPTHAMAPMAGFLAADCHKQMGNFRKAAELFQRVVEAYPDDKKVRSEAMYWRGHCLYEVREYVDAYRTFKNLTWEYPETKWAKIARGRLTDTAMIKAGEELD